MTERLKDEDFDDLRSGYEKNVYTSDVPCPSCRQRQSKVVDSRGTSSGSVRRRRACSCGRRFTTYEHIGKDSVGVSSRLARLEIMIEGLRNLIEREEKSAETPPLGV